MIDGLQEKISDECLEVFKRVSQNTSFLEGVVSTFVLSAIST